MDDFPFALEAEPAWQETQPAVPVGFACAYAPEGSCGFLLRPRGKEALFRAVQALRGDARCRCLLLAVCSEAEAARGPVPAVADLRRWMEEAERLLLRPMALLEVGARCPCGAQARCMVSPVGALRDGVARVQELSGRAQTLSGVIQARFPTLSPQDCELLYAWCHRPDPEDPKVAISQKALAKQFGCSRKRIYRMLKRAEQAEPQLFAQLVRERTHRVRRTGAYEVRAD